MDTLGESPQTPLNRLDPTTAEIQDIIVEKLDVDPAEVTYEASFSHDLGADSLDSVELIMEFEKKFEIAIRDEIQQTIATVLDAINVVTNQLIEERK